VKHGAVLRIITQRTGFFCCLHSPDAGLAKVVTAAADNVRLPKSVETDRTLHVLGRGGDELIVIATFKNSHSSPRNRD